MGDLLDDFLNKIYNLVEGSAEIKAQVQGVYFSINPSPSYPFIYINVVKIEDRSTYVKHQYELEVEISIFFRDRHLQKHLKLANMINDVLATGKFEGCKLLGLKKQNIILSNSQDMLTRKLAINYLSTIRQK